MMPDRLFDNYSSDVYFNIRETRSMDACMPRFFREWKCWTDKALEKFAAAVATARNPVCNLRLMYGSNDIPDITLQIRLLNNI
ncbi:uncharacterized protein LOC141648049 isoform X3 [Silene latifolia]|uniref:uncharacterized protein LOC141648049 isoform X3 n=1 Tax=Silene latifolia TaxID=37657 RepID=UPI003D78719A